MSVTIKDVAILAGVSPSTVSRTCKDHPSISNETKERVRAAMEELGYEPNFQASNLVSKNSKTLGIVLPPSRREAYENAIYLEMVRGISQFCNQNQYSSTVISGEDENELILVIQTIIRSGKADGFIVLFSKSDDPVTEYLSKKNVPYVLIGTSGQQGNQVIHVDNDNLQAGQDATEYLISLGHGKIAYIGSHFEHTYSNDRKKGYQLALLQHNLEVKSEYCIGMPSLFKYSREPIYNLLQLTDRPTAIVVSDDILAIVVQQVCAELEISIPGDLSIVSFNNSLIARLNHPPITSIDINAYQLGLEAAAQAIGHIENNQLLAAKSIIGHTLIQRESCRKLL